MESTVSGRIGGEPRIDQLSEDQPVTDIALLLAAALRDLDAVDRDAVDQPSPTPVANQVSEYAISVGGESIGGHAAVKPDNFRSAWRKRAKPVEPVEPAESVGAPATVAAVAPAPQTLVPGDLSTLPPPPVAKFAPLIEQIPPVAAPLTWATPSQTWQPLAPAVGHLPLPPPSNPMPSNTMPWAIQAPGTLTQLGPSVQPGPFFQPPFGAVPQGPGFVPGFVPPFPQKKRKVWPWVLAGCTIPVLLLMVMIIGAVSLLGKKVERTFNTLPYTIPAYSSPAESSAPSSPFPGSALEMPQVGQCGSSPEGTVYFQPIDCALEHDASVLYTSNFPTGTLASDPALVEFTQACASVAANEATSAADTYIDLIYGLPNGVEELHVCVLREANVGGQVNTISNTLPG